jgi:hypothetical protein
MTTSEIAQRLVTLCRTGKWHEAQQELFAPDIVSREEEATPGFAQETKGMAAVQEKGRVWQTMVEQLHGLEVSDPVIAGRSFACTMTLDVTMKGQPRAKMTELCVYRVRDGKVISEEFYS